MSPRSIEVINRKDLEQSIEKLREGFKSVQAGPATAAAVNRAAGFVQQKWVSFSSGAPIPGESRTVDNNEYRRSIQRRRLGYADWVVFVADDKAGDRVEDDQDAVDLKALLPDKFPSSRFTPDGKAYTIIPFRHKTADIKSQTKAAKSTALAKQILAMDKTFVMGSYKDSRGIKRYSYQWAKRDKQLQKDLKSMDKTHGTRLSGIVRFETSTGKGKSSAYFTFRTLSQNSAPGSWIIPAKQGVPLTKIVAKETRDEVSKIVENGIRQDLKVL